MRLPPTGSMDELIALGVVTRAHGVKGRVKVEPYNADSEALEQLERAVLRDPSGAEKAVRILSCQPAGRHFLVELEHVRTRDAADALRGVELLVPRDELPELEEGEFYWTDLFGMRVEDTQGRALGTLVDLMETGANDVLVIKPRYGRKDILLPDIPDVVLGVDEEKNAIVVDPLPGLLDE